MSQQNNNSGISISSNNNNNNNNNNIPVSEVFWSLVDKADKKFSKIRDLPYYQRNRYDTYFYKVFKAYTQLWKFQQENRQKLVETGLKRWEIGEIASRIGQLYFGQYMRTSDSSYLAESYVFYEAILTREYFKEGLYQDVNVANKQLRFLARFLMVCLVMNRREMVQQLVNQVKVLVDECKRTFQETDFKEWKLVVQEIVKVLKADTAFMDTRPLRYSLVLDAHPDALPQVSASVVKRNLKLRDAILCSYHHNEIKFSELTIDTFRMLQCLEWEPSGSFYQSSSIKFAQNGIPGSSRVPFSQDIVDPTLPPNPRKAILYRPSVTHYIAVLATICEELPPDGVLLLYLSATGKGGLTVITPSNEGSSGAAQSNTGCLQFGLRSDGGSNCIYPCDLVPFTRRPLFLVVDSDCSEPFKGIAGSEKGESIAMLLSPCSLPPITSANSSRYSSGSLFTIFLSAPLQGFCSLLGLSGADIEPVMYNNAEKLISSELNSWGCALATSDTLHVVWAQILGDPFLRRLLLRFMFCQAVLTLYAPIHKKKEFIPMCVPSLPECVMPKSVASQTVIMRVAHIFGATNSFVFSEEIVLPEN